MSLGKVKSSLRTSLHNIKAALKNLLLNGQLRSARYEGKILPIHGA